MASLLLSARGIAANAGTSDEVGQFLLLPCLTLYVEVGSHPCHVMLEVAIVNTKRVDRLSIRHFDPSEKFLSEKGFDFRPDAEANLVNKERYEYELVTPGIHQFRVVAGAQNAKLGIAINDSPGWAVSSNNGAFSPQGKTTDQYWVFKPSGVTRIRYRGATCRAVNHVESIRSTQTQDPVFTFTAKAERGEIRLDNAVQIWQVRFNGRRIRLHIGGFPVLWCDNRNTAKRFRASLEFLPDGNAVHHKFQVKIWQRLLSMSVNTDFGDASSLLDDLYSASERWLDDPDRNYFLLSRYGPWPLAREALTRQRFGKESLLFVDDGQGHLPGPAYADAMATVATTEGSFNKLYLSPQIINRAVFESFRNLLLLDEGEYWTGAGGGAAALDPYPGHTAFVVGKHGFPEFSKLSPYVSSDIRNLWQEALRRIVGRHAPMYMVSARNQSAHYLVAWAMYAKGTQLITDAEVAKRVANRYFDTAMPAGYHMEAYGPDATYSGIQHWLIAYYYHLSQDDRALESLRLSYRFFNYTVLLSEDGAITGASDFSHRTGGSFDSEQWGGARVMLGGTLPEVGIWRVAATQNGRQSGNRIEALLTNPPEKPYPINLHGPFYEFYQTPNASDYKWPVLHRTKDYNVLGNELIAINRESYYATVYVGKPSRYSDEPGTLAQRRKLQDSGYASRKNSEPVSQPVSSTAFSAGGLSILWSPSKGPMVTAKNWSPLTVHTVLVVDNEGNLSWPDYKKTKWAWISPGKILEVRGETFSSRILWRRRLEFGSNEVVVSANVEHSEYSHLKGYIAYENLPFSAGEKHKNAKHEWVRMESDNPLRVARHKLNGVPEDLLRYEIEYSFRHADEQQARNQLQYRMRL